MEQRKQKRWNLSASVALLLAVVVALTGISRLDPGSSNTADHLQLTALPRFSSLRGEPSSIAHRHAFRSPPLTPGDSQRDARAAEAVPYQVEVGVYATNNYNLDLTVPSFSGNGYVWMKWQEPLQRFLDAEKTTIQDKIVLLNGLLDGELKLSPVGPRERFEDGTYYQLFSYRSKLLVDHASYRKFPFMTVSLPIALEADDSDGMLDYHNLRFTPDREQSGVGVYGGLNGWLQRGWAIAEYRHHYGTNFGFEGEPSSYSTLVFDTILSTSAWAGFWRLILPLLVVMMMVVLVSKVRSDYVDIRAEIPVTVLLTLVFLQQNYRSELPQLPYLTFLDQVYVIAYVITLTAFALVIWIARRYQEIEQLQDTGQHEMEMLRLKKLDEVWPLAMVGLTTMSVVLCWLYLPAAA